ncbi:GNAT family N-acetyltransferase [Fictibacillus enclensis]|uniref:GNAT family N-acetyltransferase n=1 Tax=Fictibacillus enclensis TaxID=1017270 RepID=UPI0025A0E7A2|nr:GNAT family N-acetyltransferase [Fictibacillus enclensis]MDM5340295.1 GNAT family N-acetyltransferase [Fictibacillus enclensis]
MQVIVGATVDDAEEILTLQKKAYITEAEIYNNYEIEPLIQSLENVKHAFDTSKFLKCVGNDRIIGAVKATEKDGICYIGKLMVHPDCQNQGIGKRLMSEIERLFTNVDYELFTGSKSYKNIAFYESLGYRGFKHEKSPVDGTLFLYMMKNGEK